jgi:hypothetical protein
VPQAPSKRCRRTKPAGGGTCAFAAGEPPAEAAVGARRSDHRTPKKPSRNAAACGIETVVLYPGCGRERPSTFWWRVTPKKNMVHGLLRT